MRYLLLLLVSRGFASQRVRTASTGRLDAVDEEEDVWGDPLDSFEVDDDDFLSLDADLDEGLEEFMTGFDDEEEEDSLAGFSFDDDDSFNDESLDKDIGRPKKSDTRKAGRFNPFKRNPSPAKKNRVEKKVKKSVSTPAFWRASKSASIISGIPMIASLKKLSEGVSVAQLGQLSAVGIGAMVVAQLLASLVSTNTDEDETDSEEVAALEEDEDSDEIREQSEVSTSPRTKRKGFSLFGFGRPKSKLPPKNELFAQVQRFERQVASMQEENAGLLDQNQNVDTQLRNTRAELSRSDQTRKHLQSQLRDQEEMLEKAVNAERRKAKEELDRMKEAMIKVVKKERENMRQEFVRQAGKLQEAVKGRKRDAGDE